MTAFETEVSYKTKVSYETEVSCVLEDSTISVETKSPADDLALLIEAKHKKTIIDDK